MKKNRVDFSTRSGIVAGGPLERSRTRMHSCMNSGACDLTSPASCCHCGWDRTEFARRKALLQTQPLEDIGAVYSQTGPGQYKLLSLHVLRLNLVDWEVRQWLT